MWPPCARAGSPAPVPIHWQAPSRPPHGMMARAVLGHADDDGQDVVCGTGPRQTAVDDMHVARGGERRRWAGPVRGAPLDRLVPAYHISDVGLCPVDRLVSGPPAARGGTPKHAAPAHIEQPRGLQGDTRAGVPLSVCEIRRLFWGLVLAVQQRVERMVSWSTWRRWHHSIAQYWHYKRHAVS